MSGVYRFDVRPVLCEFENDAALMAEHVGVSHRTVNRWIAEGGIPEDVADEVALKAGSHPLTLWGREWEDRYRGDTEQLGLFECDYD